MARDRPTRTERLLALLLSRKGQRVSLPECQAVAGAQHGARISELRELGYVIQNAMEHRGGEVHSWYLLAAAPDETPPMFPPLFEQSAAEDCSRDEAARMRRRG